MGGRNLESCVGALRIRRPWLIRDCPPGEEVALDESNGVVRNLNDHVLEVRGSSGKDRRHKFFPVVRVAPLSRRCVPSEGRPPKQKHRRSELRRRVHWCIQTDGHKHALWLQPSHRVIGHRVVGRGFDPDINNGKLGGESHGCRGLARRAESSTWESREL